MTGVVGVDRAVELVVLPVDAGVDHVDPDPGGVHRLPRPSQGQVALVHAIQPPRVGREVLRGGVHPPVLLGPQHAGAARQLRHGRGDGRLVARGGDREGAAVEGRPEHARHPPADLLGRLVAQRRQGGAAAPLCPAGP